jgi:hypothetical protein
VNIRAILIGAATLLACQSAAAWFFFVPGGLFSGQGNRCLSTVAKVGDEGRLADGRTFLVTDISGPSSKCKTEFPILATVDILVPDEVRNHPSVQCVPPGAHVGNRIRLKGLGDVVVTDISITNTQCGSSAASASGYIQATVIGANAYQSVQAQEVTPQPTIQRVETAKEQVPAESTTAQKLRELNGMLKDGLINQDDYDAKKKELLKSF